MYFNDSTSTGLLRRVSAREASAWSDFVDRYGPWLLERCRLSGLSDADSLELCQDVYLVVLQKLDQFRTDGGEHAFRRWLITVTNNRIRELFRRRDRRPKVFDGSDGMRRINAQQRPVSDDDSAMSSSTRHLAARLIRAIQTDCEEHRWQAFWMTVGLGIPAREVAEDLGMSPGAVRQAKYSICKRLEEEFGAFQKDEGSTG